MEPHANYDMSGGFAITKSSSLTLRVYRRIFVLVVP
nr:MAG TPA: hypothetical protein [Caudoviricetes sp.]